MNIQRLELLTNELEAQKNFYSKILELPAELTESDLRIQAGSTEVTFAQTSSGFEGAYHFAFNIPANQYDSAKKWIMDRVPLLRDKTGKEDFHSNTWNSDSVYFLDAAGNVLEFIARHTLDNATNGDFGNHQILNVSESGLPSEDVIGLANVLYSQLGLSVYKQEANENFTPVGDENGLFILPIKDRIWMPDSGVPAKMLPVTVEGNTNGKEWQVRGTPYEISC
jgi:catechol-2,3-dioxygenase